MKGGTIIIPLSIKTFLFFPLLAFEIFPRMFLARRLIFIHEDNPVGDLFREVHFVCNNHHSEPTSALYPELVREVIYSFN
jgi:hypothetical protein